MPPNLVAARAGYAARHGGNIASKRHANFSQAIHIFFSSEKNVNRLRKNRVFQNRFILLIIKEIEFFFKIGQYGLGNGAYLFLIPVARKKQETEKKA